MLQRIFLVLVSSVLGVLVLAPPAGAEGTSHTAQPPVSLARAQELPSALTAAAAVKVTPGLSASPSPSPTGPADPGTGEDRESKETRTDFGPLYIAAVVLIAAALAFILRRRRGKKTIV